MHITTCPFDLFCHLFVRFLFEQLATTNLRHCLLGTSADEEPVVYAYWY